MRPRRLHAVVSAGSVGAACAFLLAALGAPAFFVGLLSGVVGIAWFRGTR